MTKVDLILENKGMPIAIDSVSTSIDDTKGTIDYMFGSLTLESKATVNLTLEDKGENMKWEKAAWPWSDAKHDWNTVKGSLSLESK